MNVCQRFRTSASILIILILGFLICSPAVAAENTSYKDVNTNVSSEAREKYTQKKGGGRDKVTVMVYMIGSDLESESGMATADLNEMLYAQIDNKNLNILLNSVKIKILLVY